MARTKRITMRPYNTGGRRSLTDHRDLSTPGTGAMGQRGAGIGRMLLIGYAPQSATPYQGIYRSYLMFDLDEAIDDALPNGWDDVAVIKDAWVSLFTREEDAPDPISYPHHGSYFSTGSEAKVRMQRLTSAVTWDFTGTGEIVDDGSADPPEWTTGAYSDDPSTQETRWEERVSPNTGGETRIKCPGLVGRWAPASSGGHAIKYREPNDGATLHTGGGFTNYGVLLRVPSESSGSQQQRAEFYSDYSVLDDKRPTLTVIVELYHPTPDAPRLIAPKDDVEPDFDFRGILPDMPEDDPITSVHVEVQKVSDSSVVWTKTRWPNPTWPDGEFLFDANVSPALPAAVPLRWKATATATSEGTASGWETFEVARDLPTVTPDAVGAVSSMEDLVLTAEATVGVSVSSIREVEVEITQRIDTTVGETAWRDPIWRGRGLPADVT